jgi:hypothetical protein
MTAPSTCIFIRSYQQDLNWLSYCLRSLHKFASGFTEIMVAVPGNEFPLFSHLTAETVIPVHDADPKYLCQQATKMYADAHTGADAILHFDSDMIMTAPVTPDFFFKDGKPIWVITPWTTIYGDEKKAWFHVMAKALRECPPYEFMRKCAVIVPRWIYAEFRAHMEKVHGIPLDAYIMSQPGHEYSEYNCLGFYAWLYHRDKFHWHDTSVDGVPTWPFRQFWSYSGLTQQERNEMEIALA